MSAFRPFLALAALVLVSAPAARAQDFRYGLTLGTQLPTADLKDFNDRPTFHVGGFADVKLSHGFTLRPRVDAIFAEMEKTSWEYWTDASNKPQSAEFKRNVYGLGAGVDVLYALPVSLKGLYATAGIGVQSLKTEALYGGLKNTETATKPTFSIGAGYEVNKNWSVSAKYVASKFKVNVPYKTYSEDPTAGGFQMSVHYTF